MGLGVGLQVDVGLCGLLNTAGAGAALWATLPLFLLSTRSRLKELSIRNCHISFREFTELVLLLETQINQFHQPFLQCQTSLMAALAFDWIHCWGSDPVICDVSVSVFASEVGLT